MKCLDNYECVYYDENPNYNLSSFDNFLNSLLIVFTASTGEGLGSIQKALVEVHGNYAFIYFLLLMFVELYFLRNFVLGILKHNVTIVVKENKKNKIAPPMIIKSTPKYKTLRVCREALLPSEYLDNRNVILSYRRGQIMETQK